MHSARSSSISFASALLALGALAVAPRASADTPAENKAAARNLATQGVQLAARGECEEAIPLLERAEALFHAPTILSSLGECQVRLGRLVEGTETLRQVVRERLPEDAPRAFFDAQARSQELLDEYQPQIAQLTIHVEPAGLRHRLLIDGSPVSAAFVGAPRPTDPGDHHVEVSAEGHETARAEITLAAGAQEAVHLTLQPLPGGSHSVLAEDPQDPSPSSTQRVLGYVGVGVGGALLTAGAITGLMAVGKENALQQRCPDGRCPPGERGALDDANSMARVATISTLGGAALGLTGLVLLVTAPSSGSEEVAARITPWLGWGSLGVSGLF